MAHVTVDGVTYTVTQENGYTIISPVPAATLEGRSVDPYRSLAFHLEEVDRHRHAAEVWGAVAKLSSP